jgi:hypothetical protein
VSTSRRLEEEGGSLAVKVDALDKHSLRHLSHSS